MAPKRKPLDKVPAGTSDAADSGSTPHVIGGNDPTLDPGKDPSQVASVTSETNTLHPTTQSTRVTDQLVHPASERGTSEDPTQTPNPHDRSGDPLLHKIYSDYSEPSERLASANPDPEELVLGDQIQEMLDTINEHMDEVTSIHNMSRQAAQLLAKTNESNSVLEARTRTLEKYPTIAKGKSSIHPRDPHKDPNNEDLDPHPERPSNWSNVDEESTSGQHNIDPELILSTDESIQLTKDVFAHLCSQWKEKYADLFGEIRLELPPMREVNHRIKLIDPDKQFNYHLPKCPEALRPQLHAKIDRYLKAGWWELVGGNWLVGTDLCIASCADAMHIQEIERNTENSI
ncbi:hypothetical protein M422DRAFT_249748 [Sphaerobolus stellatus SS14]|uniref:Uncharacterized protein n=1 Tax=Sphaerobolus stellatus (strain SS14) TaxID=990650 RepID=A0A0C9VUI3_SPHS4|nr:hypothetical protein M422DRAFT_249748 [Sphaerobolus stellatus SS14]